MRYREESMDPESGDGVLTAVSWIVSLVALAVSVFVYLHASAAEHRIELEQRHQTFQQEYWSRDRS
jgi:hypothetical protein